MDWWKVNVTLNRKMHPFNKFCGPVKITFVAFWQLTKIWTKLFEISVYWWEMLFLPVGN